MQKLRPSTGPSPRRLTVLLIGLFILMFALTMMGCAQLPTLSTARSPLPPNLTQPCPPLPPLADGIAATILRWMVQTAEQYNECARGKQALIDAVKG